MLGRRSSFALLVALAAAALALLGGCGSSGGKATGTQARTSTTAASNGPCQQVAQPTPKGPQHLRAPTLRLDPGKTWTARITTNCGAFTIRLDVARAPKTSASFASLAKMGFYDDLTFHRIAQGFVIQGGDPSGDGSGGPGYTVVEKPPANLRYTHGVVAMAKTATDPDGASGSQFFVVTAPDAGLPPQYALLGKVVQGLNVVDAIGALPLAQGANPSDGPPAQPVVMQSVTISSR
ncbi:MAG TPA: peptidylprolyl isomerase [Conexibacter sp.]|nr:peptidylprolyl isomerase [Conexibacter sp.]